MRADAWVEADAVDDGLGVQPFHLGVGVQFVEVADTQGQVGVGKELHRFGFGQTHEEGVDVFLYRPFLQECGKGAGCLIQAGVAFGASYDDTAGIEVVVQRLALAQEFGRENHVVRIQLLAHAFGVAHGDGALDDHDGVRVDALHQFNHLFHVAGIEIVLYRVVVGGGCNDHEVRINVCFGPVQGGGQVQVLFRQVFFDVIVLDGRLALVD